jgi:hypothetical protein
LPQEAIDSLFARYQNVYGQADDDRFDASDDATDQTHEEGTNHG